MVAPSGNAVRRMAAAFTPMAPSGQTPVGGPAQGAQAAAYGGPSTGQTNYRNLLAQSLIGQGLSGEPVQGPTGALAKLAQVFAGMRIQDKAETATKERGTAFNTAMEAAGNDPVAIRAAAGQFLDPEKMAELTFAMTGRPPQEPDPFTLGPGQTRYGPTGDVLASVPSEAPKQPDWQNPNYRAYETEKDERDFRQAQQLAAAAREGRELPESWGDPYEMSGVGPVQRSSRGQIRDLGGSGAGQTTPTQQANNAEIDAARTLLKNRGMKREDILAATQEMTATGRDNPEFDPQLTSIVGKATQRKIGDDPEFEQFYSGINTPAPTPVTPAAQETAAGDQSRPPAEPLPTDRAKLKVGNVYRTAQGPGIYLGGGRFEVIE